MARLLASLAYLAVVSWMMLPDHKRRELKMKAARTAQSLSDRLARRAGDSSMGTELRTGQRRYEVPYLLSLAREQAGRLYERQRSA